MIGLICTVSGSPISELYNTRLEAPFPKNWGKNSYLHLPVSRLIANSPNALFHFAFSAALWSHYQVT